MSMYDPQDPWYVPGQSEEDDGMWDSRVVEENSHPEYSQLSSNSDVNDAIERMRKMDWGWE